MEDVIRREMFDTFVQQWRKRIYEEIGKKEQEGGLDPAPTKRNKLNEDERSDDLSQGHADPIKRALDLIVEPLHVSRKIQTSRKRLIDFFTSYNFTYEQAVEVTMKYILAPSDVQEEDIDSYILFASHADRHLRVIDYLLKDIQCSFEYGIPYVMILHRRIQVSRYLHWLLRQMTPKSGLMSTYQRSNLIKCETYTADIR